MGIFRVGFWVWVVGKLESLAGWLPQACTGGGSDASCPSCLRLSSGPEIGSEMSCVCLPPVEDLGDETAERTSHSLAREQPPPSSASRAANRSSVWHGLSLFRPFGICVSSQSLLLSKLVTLTSNPRSQQPSSHRKDNGHGEWQSESETEWKGDGASTREHRLIYPSAFPIRVCGYVSLRYTDKSSLH